MRCADCLIPEKKLRELLGTPQCPGYDDRMSEPPSFLDRLIDPESVRGYNVVRMIDCVRRDLEDLLNTQRSNSNVDAVFTDLWKSVYTYGMPDLHTFNEERPGLTSGFVGSDADQQKKLCREVEAIIGRYEPRLRNVHVTTPATAEHGNVSVRFHIDAQLKLDPFPDIGFETILELTTRKATVKSREGGQ